MDDERTCIGQGRAVFRSQPDLKMGERAVPIKYLNDEGKNKTKDMEDFYTYHRKENAKKEAAKRDDGPIEFHVKQLEEQSKNLDEEDDENKIDNPIKKF